MRRLPTSINTNTYRFRKVAVTTTKKSQATMTLAWLWMKVSQRCLGSGVRAGPPSRRYFSTVRGETRIPSFSFSSLAMRSSPQVAFSAAISRIRRRRSLGRRGRPIGLDFQRQNSRNRWRCQRTSVGSLIFTSASRHGNMRLRVAINQRVESLARRGLTWRSWKSASCLRRKRFSAANARREWTARMARRIRSITTGTIVRKQCATVRKSDEPDINAQHGTLQNVTGPTTAAWQEFLRTTGPPDPALQRYPAPLGRLGRAAVARNLCGGGSVSLRHSGSRFDLQCRRPCVLAGHRTPAKTDEHSVTM